MVRRDVQENANGRTEELDGFELKGTDFQGQKVQLLGFLDDGTDRQPNVPRRKRLDVVSGQQPLDQLRRGRLTVGPGDSHVQTKRMLITKLELAEDWNLAMVDILKDRVRPRYAGTDDRKIE